MGGSCLATALYRVTRLIYSRHMYACVGLSKGQDSDGKVTEVVAADGAASSSCNLKCINIVILVRESLSIPTRLPQMEPANLN